MSKKFQLFLLRSSTVLAVGLTLFLLLARWHWIPELFTHFRLLYLVGFTLLLGITLVVRHWKSAALIGFCLLLQFFSVAPHYLPWLRDQREGSGPELKVMSYNVLSSNTEHEAVLSYLEKEQPDVLLLIEIDYQWMRACAKLKEQYPYRVDNPELGNFGFLFLSKLPITSHEVVRATPENTAFLVADLTWEGERLRFFGAHPFTPLGGRWAAARNLSLAAIKSQSEETEGMQIIAGDLNCSAFSPHFKPLKKGLLDSARGRGYSATWNRGHPILGIPIDHLLTSKNLVCKDFEVGPKNGSDHSPIIGIYKKEG